MKPRLWSRWAGLLLLTGLTILTITTNASAESKEKVLYSFQGGSDGYTPAGGVVFDKAGNLYGANTWGGTGCSVDNCGTVFELSPPTEKGGSWTETIIHAFRGRPNDGYTPVGGLIIDSVGNLYGTTSMGGNGPCELFGSPAGCGIVYELSPPTQKSERWTYTVLYNFLSGNDGYFPWGDLVFDAEGNLYGATQFGGGKGTTCNLYYGGNCGTVFELSPPKQKGGKWTERVLHSFAGGTDGATPNGGLIFDNQGAIYGTAVSGGYENGICDPGGCGTVFRLDPPTSKGGPWTKKALYSFHGQDGATPAAGVVLGRNGDLYGTVSAGASDANGAVYSLAAPTEGDGPWKETMIHRFQDRNDGTSPESALIFDAKARLYGTALGGGTHFGVIFRLNRPKKGTGWSISVLYALTGSPDGNHSTASLVFDSGGNLYGTTQWGGTGSCQGGCGTVFEVEP